MGCRRGRMSIGGRGGWHCRECATCGAGDWCVLPQELTWAIRLKKVHPSFAAGHQDHEGYHRPLWGCEAAVTAAAPWSKGEDKKQQSNGHVGKMAAGKKGEQKNGRWSKWTISAVGDAIATTREKRNEWDGFFCFLRSIEMKSKTIHEWKKKKIGMNGIDASFLSQ